MVSLYRATRTAERWRDEMRTRGCCRRIGTDSRRIWLWTCGLFLVSLGISALVPTLSGTVRMACGLFAAVFGLTWVFCWFGVSDPEPEMARIRTSIDAEIDSDVARV